MAQILDALKALYSLDTANEEDERATGVDDGGSEALSKVPHNELTAKLVV